MNLKQFKPLHWLYNIIHYKSLRHNKAAYKKYKLKRPLIGSISSKDFPDKESKAWLDVGNSALIANSHPSFNNFSESIQQKILDWSDNGYMILEGYFSNETCEKVNEEIEVLLKAEKINFNDSNKLMFANRKSALIKNVTYDATLKNVLELLLAKEIVAFQTINFYRGSEQRAHSDSIHMTTYPLGYLIAAWIALEDITPENGPLFYYPGSHKLPYLLNTDFNTGESFLRLGEKTYTHYENALEDILRNNKFERKEFYAKKGDVLIWHANLIHGGAPIINLQSTRKSMVVHYFAKDVIKYHEITERPSLIEEG